MTAAAPDYTEARELLARLTPDQRQAVVRLAVQHAYNWQKKARPNQLAPPGDWRVWLLLSGRGFGKTRTGAEWVRQRVYEGAKRIALVGETKSDCRAVMVEGEAGLLSVFPPNERPTYSPSTRKVTFHTGAIAHTYSGDEPDQLRGPEHDTAWCDEPAKFKYLSEAWSNLEFGLRLGPDPRAVASTTPRPLKQIRDWIADPDVHVTRGRTIDNRDNLPASFLKRILARYQGTRLGKQELDGQLLEDVDGAIVTLALLEVQRWVELPSQLDRIVIPIDPAVTSGEDSDETGIVPTGRAARHVYALEDCSGRYTPDEWARKAVDAYHRWQADCIVAEINNGGEMVAHTIRGVDRTVRVKVVTATRGKHVRAEPVLAYHERNEAHTGPGQIQLEQQLAGFTAQGYEGGDSPDRADAYIWGATELMLAGEGSWDEVNAFNQPVSEASNIPPEQAGLVVPEPQLVDDSWSEDLW